MTRRLIDPDHDPFRWLEEVESAEALAWVHERDARAEDELQDEGFAPLERELREILDSPDRIPSVVKRGSHLYNFWTDAEHPQGVWRRTSMESYRSEVPEWDVLLDLDELSAAEGVTWVWHGATVLRPEDDNAADEPGLWRRALVSLSRGGSDADVTREFDLVSREFVPEEAGGFCKPEGKGSLSWIDADTVYASTDQFSPEAGEPAVTTSGYPRFALRWRRDTPLKEAEPVVSVGVDDMVAAADCDSTPGHLRHVAVRMLGFYDSETYLIEPGQEDDAEVPAGPAAPRLRRVEVPTDVRVGFHRELILLMPRTEFSLSGINWPGGSLVIGDAAAFMEGDHSSLRALFTPDESTSLQGVTVTRNVILLTVMSDVVEHLEAHWRDEHDAAQWRSRRVFAGITGSLSVSAVDPREEDTVWITANDFLSPTTQHFGDLTGVLTESAEEACGEKETTELIKQAPERFDASGLAAVQRFADSADGTRVPYFLIGPEAAVSGEAASPGSSGAAERRPLPTVLYGYGGFEISQTPGYLSLTGKAWLERGGVFAVANIRGGGEYGPGWHQAARRENRHRAYEDFAAVARDLVQTGVTVREQLACRGGSNGGLLTGNMLTQYPDLFGAVVIQVPLLDMKRYAKLLAGASWRAEFGDPETEDWDFIQTFSPYHLLERGADYPSVLLTTSTRDDRVHPGHARKMTAALEELGSDVRYWENTEGGHGGAANPGQQAKMNSLIHRYLWQRLSD